MKDTYTLRMLENCYSMGVVDTDQYNIILRALQTDGLKVVWENVPLHPRGQRIKWTITLQKEMRADDTHYG